MDEVKLQELKKLLAIRFHDLTQSASQGSDDAPEAKDVAMFLNHAALKIAADKECAQHKLDEALAEITYKNALIEQMRDGLESGCVCCPNYHPERLAAVCGDCKIKAALSAAERGV